MLQLQQAQLHARAQQVVHISRSRCRHVCQAAKRNMQPAEAAQARTSTTSSSTAEDAQVSIAVPLEQPPAALEPSREGNGIAWILVAAAVAAGLVFKQLRSNDPSKEYMRSINAMQSDNLDPEIIAAARARRSREKWANHRLDLDDIELPENHPFATRKPVTAEQEAAIQARLQVRPRRAGPGGDGRQGARTRQLGQDS